MISRLRAPFLTIPIRVTRFWNRNKVSIDERVRAKGFRGIYVAD